MAWLRGVAKFAGVLAVLFLLTLTVGIIGYLLIDEGLQLLEPVDPDGEAVEITIQAGSTTGEIASLLKEQGLIRHATAFVIMARYQGVDGQLKAGDYLISPAESVEIILDRLARGEVVQISFTVPEGLRVDQIGKLLAARGLVDLDQFMEAVSDERFIPEFLTEQELETVSELVVLEGYLFPDTYRISRDYDAWDIVRVMRQRFDEVIAEFASELEESDLTVHEAITLASIVEAEAQVAEERERIAGVFHNRLEIDQRLEADPTVRYVLRDAGDLLTYDDIEIETPYNTYRNHGLPPGPIGSPGYHSIRSVLYPEDTPYFYFVAANDGTHIFSVTYQEHLRAKRSVQN